MKFFWKKLLFVIFVFYAQILHADAPKAWALYFQEPATPIMSYLKNFHDHLLWLSFGIAGFVTLMIALIIFKFRAKKNPNPSKFVHNTKLEIFWTLIPTLIIMILAVPTFKIMYVMDHVPPADLTVKVTGHQWYWSYEYPSSKIAFDSYIIKDEDLKPNHIRLLSVDRPLVVPVDSVVEVLLTSTDVIHSWAIPSFGLKKDTIPGKLNQTWFKVIKEGTYYGQCSELCGLGHGFMPIQIEVVSKEVFAKWVESQKQKK